MEEKKKYNGLEFIGMIIGVVILGFCFGVGFHTSGLIF